MMKILAFPVVFLAFISLATAQGNVIRGKLVDTTTHTPIADATITLLQPKDSALVTYSLSDAQGIFELKNVARGNYRLIISHQAYAEIIRELTVADQKQLDLGEITPSKDFKTLDEVIISSETPIVVKDDTLQFNASGFKTKPNATAEDLLKKLPGVEVDRDGNVTAQGEQVQKIYVDGKEFFANDPKLATKNITAEMIESVQVFDDMSDQAKFTNIDDGNRIKTINIKLKKNRNKGYFGRAIAGHGEQGKYRINVGANKFNGPSRLSVLFNTNNVNEQGFSMSDIASGKSGDVDRDNGSGLTKTLSTGINYSNELGNKIKITGSYFFAKSNNMRDQNTLRRSSFPDSIASLNRESSSLNNRNNHRFNMRFEYMIDSANSLLYTPSLNVQHSENERSDTSFTFSEFNDRPGYLSGTGTTSNSSKRDGLSWNNNLLFRHKFGKTGRTITLGWNNSISNNDNEGSTFSRNLFYDKNGDVFQNLYRDQQNQQKSNSHNNVISTSYTEPLGLNKLVEVNYAYTHNYNTSDKKTYDYNSVTGKYDDPNLEQTNHFKNVFLAHRAGVNFRVKESKYNYQFGIAMQRSSLESQSYQAVTGKDSVIKASYTNFFPTANFNLTPRRGKNLRFRYRGRTEQPSISQLQDVPDVSDPLNIRTGNPDLKQEFNHNMSLSYHSFNVVNYRLIAANLNFSTTSNKIVNSIDSVGTGVQLIRPQNVNGYYNVSSFITLGFPFKNPDLKGSGFNFSNNLSYTRDISLLYKRRNIGQTMSVRQSVGFNFNKGKLDMGIKARLAYTSVQYSVNKEQNDNYFTHTYSGDFTYIFPKNIILSTDFDYYVNTGRAEGFNQSVPLWNATISKLLFQKKNGEIRFSVNDILNQNQSINRTAEDNYIQDTRSTVLRRYFMLSFLYNLNKMGGRSRDGSSPRRHRVNDFDS